MALKILEMGLQKALKVLEKYHLTISRYLRVIICQLISELLSTNDIISIWYNGDPSPKKLSG